jgi:hypothetical protein
MKAMENNTHPMPRLDLLRGDEAIVEQQSPKMA